MTLDKEKGEIGFAFLLGTYRFLSTRKSSSPTNTIATIAPAPIPNTYVSVMGAGVGVGPGVAAGASSTNKEVCAKEPQ